MFREGTCNERGVLGEGRRGEGNGTNRGKRLTVYKEVGSELLRLLGDTRGPGPCDGAPSDVKWRIHENGKPAPRPRRLREGRLCSVACQFITDVVPGRPAGILRYTASKMKNGSHEEWSSEGELQRRRHQRNDQEVSERSAAVQSCRSEPKLVLGSIGVRLFLLSIRAVIAVKSFSPALPMEDLSWLGGPHHHQRMCRADNGGGFHAEQTLRIGRLCSVFWPDGRVMSLRPDFEQTPSSD
jgi:hypothetical protein